MRFARKRGLSSCVLSGLLRASGKHTREALLMKKSWSAQLGKAKRAKEDEFYTRLEDIERELRHYEQHFKGKTVLCNCDDPFESGFCKFFLRNFNYLSLE